MLYTQSTVANPSDVLIVMCRIEGMMCARLFTKGAAEQILELCTLRVRDDSGVARFSQQEKQDLLNSFSGDGTRSVLLALLMKGFLIVKVAAEADIS